MGDWVELEQMEGEKIVFGICCMKEETIFNKIINNINNKTYRCRNMEIIIYHFPLAYPPAKPFNVLPYLLSFIFGASFSLIVVTCI